MRSDTVTKGKQQAPHRSLFNALGLTEEEMNRPLVGIVCSYNEIVPGHMNLDKIANAVKQGVAMAGTYRNEVFSGNQRPDRRFYRGNGNGTSV